MRLFNPKMVFIPIRSSFSRKSRYQVLKYTHTHTYIYIYIHDRLLVLYYIRHIIRSRRASKERRREGEWNLDIWPGGGDQWMLVVRMSGEGKKWAFI